MLARALRAANQSKQIRDKGTWELQGIGRIKRISAEYGVVLQEIVSPESWRALLSTREPRWLPYNLFLNDLWPAHL